MQQSRRGLHHREVSNRRNREWTEVCPGVIRIKPILVLSYLLVRLEDVLPQQTSEFLLLVVFCAYSFFIDPLIKQSGSFAPHKPQTNRIQTFMYIYDNKQSYQRSAIYTVTTSGQISPIPAEKFYIETRPDFCAYNAHIASLGHIPKIRKIGWKTTILWQIQNSRFMRCGFLFFFRLPNSVNRISRKLLVL